MNAAKPSAQDGAQLVLFILWHSGAKHHHRLLREIQDKFSILIVRTGQFPQGMARKQLSDLYHRPAEELHNKENEIGDGPYTVVIAVDHRPGFTWSKRGNGYANRRTHRIKTRERRAGHNYLHASDLEADAVEFATRLLDLSPQYLLDLKRTSVASRPQRPARDLAHIFDILNQGAIYTVIRNWQHLPEGLASGHGDVDILVEDPAKVLALFPDARKKHTLPQRAHFFLPVRRPWYLLRRKNHVRFDLRHLGDNYYEETWQRRMLQRRVWTDRGFYHLCDEDHFWTLLYHAILHKPKIRDDYKQTLTELGRNIPGWSGRMFDDPAACVRFVEQHVPLTRPNDPSVGWKGAT